MKILDSKSSEQVQNYTLDPIVNGICILTAYFQQSHVPFLCLSPFLESSGDYQVPIIYRKTRCFWRKPSIWETNFFRPSNHRRESRFQTSICRLVGRWTNLIRNLFSPWTFIKQAGKISIMSLLQLFSFFNLLSLLVSNRRFQIVIMLICCSLFWGI